MCNKTVTSTLIFLSGIYFGSELNKVRLRETLIESNCLVQKQDGYLPDLYRCNILPALERILD